MGAWAQSSRQDSQTHEHAAGEIDDTEMVANIQFDHRDPVVTLASGEMTVNAIHLATAAATYDIPDGACDAAADVGNWVTVVAQDASEVIIISSDDASNIFTVPHLGTLDAGDVLDSVSDATGMGTHITLTCVSAENWYATSLSYIDVDGAGNTDMAWADGGAS